MGGAAVPSPGREVVRIAMWSGPRTLSTALMRSFGNRADTVVVDEPLYGYYLARTGVEHPGREEIIASMPCDWAEVIERLTSGPLPAGATVFYQKHMTHHLLPEVDRARLAGLRHAFLIRDPRGLLASYAKVRQAPTLADLGLEQQVDIYRRFGGPVIDAADLAARPRATLEALCAALGIPFDPAMLAWPTGPRSTDGVWAKYWYARVWESAGFESPQPEKAGEPAALSRGNDRPSSPRPAPPVRSPPPVPPAPPLPPAPLPPHLEPLASLCHPYYAELLPHALRTS